MAGSGGTESLLVGTTACRGDSGLGNAHSLSTTSFFVTQGSYEHADAYTIPRDSINLHESMHTGHGQLRQRPHIQLGHHPNELQGAPPSEIIRGRHATPFASRAGSEVGNVNGCQVGAHFVSNSRETQETEADGICAESGAPQSKVRQARQPTPFASRAGSEAGSDNVFEAGPYFDSHGRETHQTEEAVPSQSTRVRHAAPFAPQTGREVSSDDNQTGAFDCIHVDQCANIENDLSQAGTPGAACALRPTSPHRDHASPTVHTFREQAVPPPPERRGASAASPRQHFLKPPGNFPTLNSSPMREPPQTDARSCQPHDDAHARAASVSRPETFVIGNARPPSPDHRQHVQQELAAVARKAEKAASVARAEAEASASNCAVGGGAGQQDVPIDLPRLIWQLEKQHAAVAGRLQAELRSLRQEFAVLRGEWHSTRVSQCAPEVSACQDAADHRAAPMTASDSMLVSSLAGEVEQVRHVVQMLGERLAGNRNETLEITGRLREDLKKCFAEAAASASAAKSAARSSAKLFDEAETMHIRSDVADSIERRVLALEEVQRTERNGSYSVEESVLDMRAQVATLERQMEHLHDLSAEASRNSEQDQATLCALLRTSRVLAERLGVGPVLLGRESHHKHSAKGLVAEAESLAASVAAGWRRQKASGVIPAGAANILEAMHLQRFVKGPPFASARESCGRDGSVEFGSNDDHAQRHAIPTASVPLADRVLYCTEGPAASRHRSWHADPCTDYDPEQRKFCFAYT